MARFIGTNASLASGLGETGVLADGGNEKPDLAAEANGGAQKPSKFKGGQVAVYLVFVHRSVDLKSFCLSLIQFANEVRQSAIRNRRKLAGRHQFIMARIGARVIWDC